jgi:hypothetical protein
VSVSNSRAIGDKPMVAQRVTYNDQEWVVSSFGNGIAENRLSEAVRLWIEFLAAQTAAMPFLRTNIAFETKEARLQPQPIAQDEDRPEVRRMKEADRALQAFGRYIVRRVV